MIRFRLLQTPYAGDMMRHPLFRLDARQVPWLRSPERFRGQTWRVIAVMHVLLLTVWLVILAVHSANKREFSSSQMAYVDGPTVISFLATAIIPLSAILDFICLQASLKSISGEVIAGRWDLLRLTALSEGGIVRAKHAGVRLRVWRSTMMIVGLRTAAVTISLFALLIWPYVVTGENVNIGQLAEAFMEAPLSSIALVITAAVTVLVYIVEPVWRVQAFSALGMTLSAYIGTIPLAMLASVGAIFALWLVQIIVAAVLFFSLGFGLGALLAPLIFYESSPFPLMLYILLSCIITAVTIWGFYALLQAWGLRRVLYRIDKVN